MSSVQQIVAHPAHLAIVAMGDRAVPWILRELEGELGHWFSALTAITGENPILLDDRGNMSKMRDSWLDWGRANGHID